MTRTTKTTAWSLLATVSALAISASAVHAQTAPATVSATRSGDQLEEVTVTAQRRAESAQSVPITIEALSGDQLAALNITNSTDLSAFTPGLNISRANVGAVPFLRGIGNFTATVGNEAAIATYIDEVYRPGAGSSNYAFNNVERVEVLNGPQGTLFGRNAAGGVINVITRDPTQKTQIDESLTYANYNNVTNSLYIGGGVTDNLAADISVYVQHQSDGWGKNLYDGTDAYLSNEYSLRSKWIYTPTADDKVTLIGYYDRARNDVGSASNIMPGTVTQAGYSHAGGFYDINTNFDPYGETRNYGTSLKAEHDFGWSRLISISSYGAANWTSVIENDSSPANLQEARVNAKETTYQEEVRLESGDNSKIKWMGGLFYFYDRAHPDPFTQYGTSVGNPPSYEKLTYSTQDTKSYAAFGQMTLPIDEITNITLGARYTDDNRHFWGTQYTLQGKVLSTGDQTTDSPKPTFRVAVDHNFDENVMGYVSWNRGFKSGNFNTNTPTAPATLPEVLDAYEAGLKTDFFDKRLRVDVAGFYDKFHDLQVQQQLITGTLQTNAAAAEYKGVDLSINTRITHAFSLNWSAEYLDATYSSYPSAVFYYYALSGRGMSSTVGNATGNDIPYADKFTSTLSGRYVLETDHGSYSAVGSVGYHNGFNFDVQGLTHQPAYWLANASVDWTAPSGQWDVKLWGENIFNQQWYSQQQVSAVGLTYAPSAPSTFGITASYHLN